MFRRATSLLRTVYKEIIGRTIMRMTMITTINMTTSHGRCNMLRQKPQG